MKRVAKPKIGKILSWNPDTKVGWIRCQISSVEFREYHFDWRVLPDLYFPIAGDRICFEVKPSKKGNTVASVEFIRTGN